MRKSSSGARLSVVIPAYNEGGNIRETVLKLIDTLNKIDIVFEVIIVDDGSSDNSYVEIPKIPKVRKTRHENNMGYGAALKTGIRKARYRNVLILDADGTYPIDSIPELINEIDNYDMVVGARIGENVSIPFMRKPAKWMLNKLANYLANYKIPDLNSGMRIIKRVLINEFWNLLPPGFSFTTTITLAALTNNYNVKFIPIDYYKRGGKSKIKPLQDTKNFVTLILHTIVYFRPLKIFIPTGLSLFLLSMIKFVYDGIVFKFYFSGATIVLAMMGLQVIILGVVADLVVSYRKGNYILKRCS